MTPSVMDVTGTTDVFRSHFSTTLDASTEITRRGLTLLMTKAGLDEPYRIVDPIHVTVYSLDDGWMAVFEDADIAFASDSWKAAFEELEKEILDAFEDFEEMESTGEIDAKSAKKLAVLRRHIRHAAPKSKSSTK